jgi:hypothetical protein
MDLQTYRKPVRGGTGEAGSVAQLGQATRLFRYCLQHGHSLVQDPDPAMLSHVSILTSRMMGCPDGEIGIMTDWGD